MKEKKWVFSGTSLESAYGYSRAIRQGDRIVVSGCAPIEADGSSRPDAAGQAARCFEIIRQAITDLGGRTDDIIRTRLYLTSRDDLDAVMRVHKEWVGEAKPTCSAIIAELARPEWKVEIEAEAVCIPE
ncbi:RidA family protein [Sphingobium subterraneum]|uniref:Enamine deaminase RidA (YjgF/YER057c/UK114 family) n=1 Tax=Sphingobium subterraneum TaxID=627688 RepID=A0A841IYJ4_9SPHN|nr:RidA family protein [Sphingobium subterraneum]MBB6123677.1 enamine deaminase RidA (YjgF/YER057c/UK114 family) [Sphingobium subterraneum]